jgi:hypothetical protein
MAWRGARPRTRRRSQLLDAAVGDIDPYVEPAEFSVGGDGVVIVDVH